MRKRLDKTRRGDTIIEVIFAIAIFCLVAIISVNLMSSGITITEASLEQTLVRAEISAQVEALRFLHNAYIAEFEYPEYENYVPVWNRITDRAIDSSSFLDMREVDDCEAMFDSSAFTGNKPFIINTRRLSGSDDLTEETNLLNALVTPSTAPFTFSNANPRVIFTNGGNNSDDAELLKDEYRDVARVEGIWVTAVRGDVHRVTNVPKFYDFYVRTCWVAPGRNYPTKLGTVIRLYNPQSEEYWEGP